MACVALPAGLTLSQGLACSPFGGQAWLRHYLSFNHMSLHPRLSLCKGIATTTTSLLSTSAWIDFLPSSRANPLESHSTPSICRQPDYIFALFTPSTPPDAGQLNLHTPKPFQTNKAAACL